MQSNAKQAKSKQCKAMQALLFSGIWFFVPS